jgi:MFS transporter, DHA2 family, multidrug resistance protein
VHLQKEPLFGAALLLIGLLALAAFVWYQMRAVQPLMNMHLFRYRQFAMGALVAFIYGMGLFGSTYLLPVYMQMALHYSPSHAGLVLLPAGIVLALVIPLAGRLADSFSPHLLVTLGLGLLTLSFGLMTGGSATTTFLALAVWAVIGRAGLGFVLPALSLGSMRGVSADLIAQGASTISFLRQMGGAIGVSVAGIVLEWRLAAYHVSLTDAAADGAARIHAFDETFWFVTAICALAMLAAWHMRPVPASAPADPAG